MANRALIFLGLAAAGGLLLITTREAGASTMPDVEPEPVPPPTPPVPAPNPPEDPTGNVAAAVSPPTEFPWMTYSNRTQQVQNAINNWRNIIGTPLIAEDGILGPITCRAWWSWYQEDQFASIIPPKSCNGYR